MIPGHLIFIILVTVIVGCSLPPDNTDMTSIPIPVCKNDWIEEKTDDG